MKAYFRQSMAWLHTWGCLVAGWLLFFIFLLGTATVFHIEISRWMQPERPLDAPPMQPVDRATALAHALDYLEQHAAGQSRWDIYLPHERHRHRQEKRALLAVGWRGDLRGQADLDPHTGAEVPRLAVRDTEGGRAFLELHSELHYLGEGLGKRIVAAAALLGLLGLVTGVIVHKKIFQDFFTFRPGKGQRSWLDAHNVAGVMALPFFVMIIYSGLVYFDRESLPAPVAVAYGTSQGAVGRYYTELLHQEQRHLPVQRPKAPLMAMVEQAERTLGTGEVGQITITHPAGQPLQVRMRRPYGSELPRHETPETEFRFDAATGALLTTPALGPGIRLRFVMLTLHDGWFARPMLLWLYVLSGLLGCFMIATGMVLWVVKRRDRHARRGDAPWGVELVARLNVGMLAGLLLGMAAFFWANRLLPVGLEGRAAWEIHGLFAVWLVAIVYGLLRPEKRAWVEVLSLAALAFGLVPLLNALTTDRHLGVTLPAGDGGLAGFDLSMLALALLLGAAAWRLRRKWFGAAMRRNTP